MRPAIVPYDWEAKLTFVVSAVTKNRIQNVNVKPVGQYGTSWYALNDNEDYILCFQNLRYDYVLIKLH